VAVSSGNDADLAGQTVLAIFAHPDDESLACGGTLARLADAGVRVVLLCATRGERGGPTGPVRDDALALIRVQELRCASAALRIADVILMDHPDGELDWDRVAEFQGQIVATVRRYTPNAVITFGADGLYWHKDHIGVYERTMTALRSLGTTAPPIYHVTMPRGMIRPLVQAAVSRGWTPPLKGFWSLIPDAFGLHAEPPTVIVQVQPWVAQKMAAILCHKTQMGIGHPFDDIEPAEAERWLGTEYFHRSGASPAQPAVLELIGSLTHAV
jgi:LmbE family N-acetylglucosaminyl deacetylase